MTAPNPTFVLVPGMWHRPAFFNKTREHLAERRFASVAVDLPSSAPGTNAAVVSREPDVAAVAAVIRPVLDRGEDVVVVMHSFGGISGSEATGRVLLEEEEEEESVPRERRAGRKAGGGRGGPRGKIRRLVYVTAFLASENELVPVIQSVVDDYVPDFFDVQDGGILKCNQRAKEWFYGDEIPPAEQEKHFRALGSNPIAPFFEPVRHAPWKQVPSTYVYSTVDKPVPFPMMRYMVERARADAAAEVEDGVVFGGELGEFHVDAAHSAIFLAPERVREVGDILVKVAKGE